MKIKVLTFENQTAFSEISRLLFHNTADMFGSGDARTEVAILMAESSMVHFHENPLLSQSILLTENTDED